MENNINSFSSTIDRVKDYIGKKSRKISRIILVALCIGLIIYFMPKQKSVYYDFKYNTPWAHEQLRAEFDFDVPKTSEGQYKKTAHSNIQADWNTERDIQGGGGGIVREQRRHREPHSILQPAQILP